MALLILITSFTSKKPVDLIEYYGPNQNSTLNELITEAYKESKTPILYFYANWCGSCIAFKNKISDKKIKKALANARFIQIDIDADEEGFAYTYGIRSVPTFIKMNKDAEVLAKITSAKWEEDTPKNIAPVMDKLVNTNTYNK